MNFLDGLAQITARAFGPLLAPAVLTQTNAASDGRGGMQPGGLTATPCRALVDDTVAARGAVTASAKITVLAGTLAGVVPAPGDTLMVAERVWTVVEVAGDAAGATWELSAR